MVRFLSGSTTLILLGFSILSYREGGELEEVGDCGLGREGSEGKGRKKKCDERGSAGGD